MHVLAISPGEGVNLAQWRRVLDAGVDGFMIREPRVNPRELLVAARWVRKCAPGVELWVNGRLDVALATGSGLHAPEHYPLVPPGLLPISRPIHDPIQLALRGSAQQLLLSPIHPVPGKGAPWGVAKLHRVLDQLPDLEARILALGGITPDNVAALRHPRLDGIAVIRALWTAPEPAAWVARFREAWHQGH